MPKGRAGTGSGTAGERGWCATEVPDARRADDPRRTPPRASPRRRARDAGERITCHRRTRPVASGAMARPTNTRPGRPAPVRGMPGDAVPADHAGPAGPAGTLTADPANDAGRQAPGAGATAEGTARYAARFGPRLAADFYRPLRAAARDVTLASIGVGTYLGECTDDDDRRYEAAIGLALAS